MNKNLPIVIVVLALLAVGGILLFAKNESTTATQGEQATSTGTVSTEKFFSLTDIATHSGRASCYSAIEGKVYDLTAWIDQHPGGAQNILSICGKDGTAAFVAQHGGKQKQADILKTFLIGELKT